MAMSLYLLAHHRIIRPEQCESKSYAYKKFLFITTLVSILASMYFFARHNTYCEPLSKYQVLILFGNFFMTIFLLVYTWFALCEYMVVLCNMAFHVTAYLDFYACKWNFKPEEVFNIRSIHYQQVV